MGPNPGKMRLGVLCLEPTGCWCCIELSKGLWGSVKQMGGRSQISRKMTVSPAFSSDSYEGSIYDDIHSFRTLGEPTYHGRSMWPGGAVHLMLEHKQKEETRVLYYL